MPSPKMRPGELVLLQNMWQSMDPNEKLTLSATPMQLDMRPEASSSRSSPSSGSSSDPKPMKRSRSGCQECRRLHRKCDEVKPSCGFCRQHSRHCSYKKVFQWGGRPFDNSRFGGYIGRGAIKVPSHAVNTSSNASFVYGTGKPTQTTGDRASGAVLPDCSTGTTSQVSAASSAPMTDVRVTATRRVELSSIPGALSWLPWLPASYRALLDHFTHSVVRLFVLDPQSVKDTCAAIIPMAVCREQSFHLLASVLCLASTHRRMLGLHQNDAEIAHWKDLCIQHMQRRLDQPADDDAKSTFAATALILSMCDIVTGGEKPDTWRSHLIGALAVLDESSLESGNAVNFYQRQILKLCKSLQLQTTMTHHVPRFVCPFIPASIMKQEGYDYIHEFHGFSTHLSVVLEDLQTLTVERAALTRAQEAASCSLEAFEGLWELFDFRGQRLAKRVKYMLQHPITRLDPHLEVSGTSEAMAHDYRCLNEAYHHVALLQVYSRVLLLPSSHPDVQESVRRGIAALRKIAMRDEACPGVMMLQPLFAMGCEADRAQDRDFIGFSLVQWKAMYGTANVLRGQEFLTELWRRRDELTAEDNHLHWHDLMHELGWDLSLW